jgi:hypothetical protein
VPIVLSWDYLFFAIVVLAIVTLLDILLIRFCDQCGSVVSISDWLGVSADRCPKCLARPRDRGTETL